MAEDNGARAVHVGLEITIECQPGNGSPVAPIGRMIVGSPRRVVGPCSSEARQYEGMTSSDAGVQCANNRCIERRRYDALSELCNPVTRLCAIYRIIKEGLNATR
ncbi:hypothetical protein GCM10028797_06160 [Dyella agri]